MKRIFPFVLVLGFLTGCGYQPGSPLAKAVVAKDQARVERLLATHTVSAPELQEGLIAAARTGNAVVVPLLARERVDLDLPSGVNGWTPLMHAIHKHQPAAVRALLAAGADPNHRSQGGTNALVLAAAAGQADSVRLLLDAGADLAAQDGKGQTALEAAVLGTADIDGPTLTHCQTETAQLLLEHAPSQKMRPGLTLAAHAKGCTELERLLALHSATARRP